MWSFTIHRMLMEQPGGTKSRWSTILAIWLLQGCLITASAQIPLIDYNWFYWTGPVYNEGYLPGYDPSGNGIFTQPRNLVYDPLRRVGIFPVVFPAPYSGGKNRFETYFWNGYDYYLADRTDVSSFPPRLELEGAAFDTAREKLVLFLSPAYNDGNDHARTGETWEWNASGWHKASTTGPPNQHSASMAYDPKRQRTVMFGGSRFGLSYDKLTETWEWDGSQWHYFATANNEPPEGARPPMAWNEKMQQLQLYEGGQGRVWTWNGAKWSVVATGGPRKSEYSICGMAYDSVHECMLVVGGRKASDAIVQDRQTWAWSGTTWSRFQDFGGYHGVAFGGLPNNSIMNMGMVFDPPREQLVLIGGYYATDYVAPWGYPIIFGPLQLWVDVNETSKCNIGTFHCPFTSLADGIEAATNGTLVKIKPGVSPESIHITKSVQLRAPLGPATFGRRP
jgi:hypothetical protein